MWTNSSRSILMFRYISSGLSDFFDIYMHQMYARCIYPNRPLPLSEMRANAGVFWGWFHFQINEQGHKTPGSLASGVFHKLSNSSNLRIYFLSDICMFSYLLEWSCVCVIPANRENKKWKFSFFCRKQQHVNEFWQKVSHSISDYKYGKTRPQGMSLMKNLNFHFLFSPIFRYWPCLLWLIHLVLASVLSV